MHNLWGHFKTITAHKLRVMRLCFRCGLYKQGLLHDLSKYSWQEFHSGVKYYQGNKSPNGVERKLIGYSTAWLHHKGRNKHHLEYWVDLIHGEAVPARMPLCYVIEMFCDRVAATKTYQKKAYTDASALQYFTYNYDNVIMNQDTKDLLQIMLEHLAQHGLDDTIHFIKTEVKEKGYTLLEYKA